MVLDEIAVRVEDEVVIADLLIRHDLTGASIESEEAFVNFAADNLAHL